MRHDSAWGVQPKQGLGVDDALPILIKGCRAITEFGAELAQDHGGKPRILRQTAIGWRSSWVTIPIWSALDGEFPVDEDPAKAVDV